MDNCLLLKKHSHIYLLVKYPDRYHIITVNNKLDELFKMLFIKQCNKLSEILPELFEDILKLPHNNNPMQAFLPQPK